MTWECNNERKQTKFPSFSSSSLSRRDLFRLATRHRHLLYSFSSCPDILRLYSCAPPFLCEWDWPSSFLNASPGRPELQQQAHPLSDRQRNLDWSSREKKNDTGKISQILTHPSCRTPVASVFPVISVTLQWKWCYEVETNCCFNARWRSQNDTWGFSGQTTC